MKPFAYFRGVGFTFDATPGGPVVLLVDDLPGDHITRVHLDRYEAAALAGALLAAVDRTHPEPCPEHWCWPPGILDRTLRDILDYGLPDTVEEAIREFEQSINEAGALLEEAEARKEETP